MIIDWIRKQASRDASRQAQAIRAGSGTQALVLLLTIPLLVLSFSGCSSKQPKPRVVKTKPAPPARVCRLNQLEQAFECDLEFSASSEASCAKGPGFEEENEFLRRMTVVSIRALYLEGEAGARPPYRYASPGDIFARIQKQNCRVDQNAASQPGALTPAARCVCRMRYQDPELLQVFYHSAGCRRSSRLADNPLYFRGNGCY